jgi:hypothetical protein
MGEAMAKRPKSAGNGSLTPRQWGAVPALVSEPTIKAAASASGIGERTLHRWMRDQTFRAYIERACEDSFQHAIASLRAGAGKAVETLQDALRSDSESIRVRAAQGHLNMTIRLEEHRLARADALRGRLTRTESLEFFAAVAEAVREFIPDPTDRRDFVREVSRIHDETSTFSSGRTPQS